MNDFHFENNSNQSHKETPKESKDSNANPKPETVDNQTQAHSDEASTETTETSVELKSDDLQIELISLQTELRAMTETAKRAMADLQNVRRHHNEEKDRLTVYANIKLLNAIFPAIDNFDRAISTQPENLKEDTWTRGIISTGKLLLTALEQMGLEVIDQINVPVDPFRHEVLMQGEGQDGTVLQIFEKGYAFKGEVIRPAKVMVGRK